MSARPQIEQEPAGNAIARRRAAGLRSVVLTVVRHHGSRQLCSFLCTTHGSLLASSMYVLLAGCVASHSKQSIVPSLFPKQWIVPLCFFGRWSAVAVICVKDSHGWPGKEQQTFLLCLKKRLPRHFPFLLAWVCAHGEETDNCCVSPSKIVSLLSILLERRSNGLPSSCDPNYAINCS